MNKLIIWLIKICKINKIEFESNKMIVLYNLKEGDIKPFFVYISDVYRTQLELF